MKYFSKRDKKNRRHKRVRAKVFGTADRPRLSVFRSSRHILVQLIDDAKGVTLVAADDGGGAKSRSRKAESGITRAERAGSLLAEKAVKKGIHRVVFDRGGYRYHGIVRACAESARKGGLKF